MNEQVDKIIATNDEELLSDEARVKLDARIAEAEYQAHSILMDTRDLDDVRRELKIVANAYIIGRDVAKRITTARQEDMGLNEVIAGIIEDNDKRVLSEEAHTALETEAVADRALNVDCVRRDLRTVSDEFVNLFGIAHKIEIATGWIEAYEESRAEHVGIAAKANERIAQIDAKIEMWQERLAGLEE